MVMAWIRTVDAKRAEGRLKEIYDKFAPPDNILKIHSLNVPVLEGHLALYTSACHGRSGLSRSQREMIAIVVSVINSCEY